MFKRLLLVLSALWLVGLPRAAAQRPPTIAAAANLNVALSRIATQFERDRGARVDVVFGASGTLTRQIRDGAPFEMFLAADEEFPRQLARAGLTRDAGVSTRLAASCSSLRPAHRSPSTNASTACPAW